MKNGSVLLLFHPKKVLFLVITLLAFQATKAQKFYLGQEDRESRPSPDTRIRLQDVTVYEASLKQYYRRKWQADRQEFQPAHKKKWWFYLPNVGWAFGLPTVSFGTSTLAQVDRDKGRRKGKLDGINARTRNEYNEALLHLRTRYRLLVVEIEHLNQELKKTQGLVKGIIQVYDDALNDEKITPLDHLQKSLEHERFVLKLEEQNKTLVSRWLELEEFARYQMPDESLEAEEKPNRLLATGLSN